MPPCLRISEQTMLPHEADQELDATGLSCPLPVLRAHRILKTMQSGEVLRLLSTDPASRKEIPAFCEQTGHRLLREEMEEEGKLVFIIRRG